MARELTWSFLVNQTPSDNVSLTQQSRSFFQQLKTFLVGTAGWTVSQSSDSTQVQSSDTWSALSNIVAGTGVHSWMVFKSPVGIAPGPNGTYLGDQSRLWFQVDLRYANYYQAYFKLHTAEPTGGTTSASPTSPNQLIFATQQFNRSAQNINARFHFFCTSGGCFIVQLGYVGAGYLPFAVCLFPSADLNIIDTLSLPYPYANGFFCAWSDTTLGALARSNLISSTYLKCFGYDGTASLGALNALGTGTAWIGANWPSSGDNINGKHSDSSVFLTCEEAFKYGRVCRVPDIFGSSQPTTQGAVYADPPLYTKCGSLWVPTDVELII